MSDTMHCCEMDCDSDAEFEVIGHSGHPEDVTHACREHVGVLLGTPEWLTGDNDTWTVRELTDA